MVNKHKSREQETVDYLSTRGWHIRAIRAAILDLTELGHDEIARRIGKGRTTVTNALRVATGSEDTLVAISRLLRVDAGKFFPDSCHRLDYGADGQQKEV